MHRHFGFSVVALFLLLVVTSSAHAGTLMGEVRDSATHEPLIGVRISIIGTKLGAISRLDGSFAIHGIPVGEARVRVSYSGYAPIEVPLTIEVETHHDFNLSQLSFHGKETTVVAQTENGSDANAQLAIRDAQNVVNTVSSRSIEVSPDLSVADVSQRVSGVSLTRSSSGDGEYAIIRGMDKRYNYTLVNGVKIPSPDNKNRYVPLDIFPSELLDRLDVTKSLLPTMEGDAIGGSMNLIMKQAPDRLIVNAKVASGYDGLYLGRKFYTVDVDPAAKSPRLTNGANSPAKVSDFPVAAFSPRPVDPGPNQYYAATVGDRFFEDRSLGVIASGTFQRTSCGANTLFFPTTADQATSLPTFTDEEYRLYSTLQTRTGFMANVDYHAAETSTLQLFGMYADLKSQEVRDQYDSILGLSWPQSIRIPWQRRVTVEDQSIANLTLSGKQDIFGKDLEAEWDLVYSRAALNQPDRAQLDLYGGIDLNNATGQYTSEPYNVNNGSSRTWTSSVDQDKSLYLTLRSTESLFGLATELSYGGMYRMKVRSAAYDSYNLREDNSRSIQRYNGNIALDTFTVFNPLGSPDDPLNYDAHENVAAGFVQASFLLGDLETTGGVRFENTDFGWTSAAPEIFVGKTGTLDYLDILPSVSFKYSPVPDQNWKLSYFRSISRPGFYEVIPNNGVAGEDYTELTNPYLNRTQASNIDARWEYFPGGLDEVLVGAFYKNIQDPIEYTVVEVKTSTYLEPQNWGTATNFGFELNLRKFFSKFGVQANYTFTNSSITTDKKVDYRSSDPNVGLTYRVVSQTRPLQGQSEHIGNLSLLYKDFDNGTDAQIAMVYTGQAIVGVSPFNNNDIWSKSFIQLDFSAEQVLVHALALYIKVNNILNTPREEVIHQTYTQPGTTPISNQTQGQDFLIRREYYDRTYTIGLRLKM